MGHVTIIVINYQQLMNISDIKMTFGINKTVTQADSGNSPLNFEPGTWNFKKS
jgi:hypothetical protein